MWKDPIVEEVRAAREQIARECHYDLGEIMAYLRKRQAAHMGRVVRKADRSCRFLPLLCVSGRRPLAAADDAQCATGEYVILHASPN